MTMKEKVSYPVAIIGGNEFRVSKDKTKCFYAFEWRTIYTVPEKFGSVNIGSKYILFKDQRRYIEEIIEGY